MYQPRYWCKYCKTHVRDTALEKRNHEATPRHAGNLSRSLRDLHRDNEREARDVQRAKNEAARLNGFGLGSGFAGIPGAAKSSGSGAGGPATADDRKRQLAQLAALGVAVPEEFRQENAMPGEWEASAGARNTMPLPPRRAVGIALKKEEEQEGEGRFKEEGAVKKEKDADEADNQEEGLTGRKRGVDGEEWREQGPSKKRPVWGRDVKTYKADVDDDLEALLGSTLIGIQVRRQENDGREAVMTEPVAKVEDPVVKDEPEDVPLTAISAEQEGTKPEALAAGQEEDSEIGSLFKKRKLKTIRQK